MVQNRTTFSAYQIDDRLNDEALAEIVLIRDWALSEGTESVAVAIKEFLGSKAT